MYLSQRKRIILQYSKSVRQKPSFPMEILQKSYIHMNGVTQRRKCQLHISTGSTKLNLHPRYHTMSRLKEVVSTKDDFA